MGRGSRKVTRVVKPESDSDEGDDRIADGISDEELADEIDEFHSSRDKVMLGEDSNDDDDDSDDDDDDEDEDAVMGIDADSDSEDDDDDDDGDDVNSVGGSDAESDGEEEKITSGWGKSRKEFYNQDFVDPDFDFDEQQEEDAKEEEEEALRLQALQMAELDEDDYGLPFGGLGKQDDRSKMKKKKGDKTESDMVAELDNELDTIGMDGVAGAAVETIGKDLTHMSTEDRLVQLAEQAPELLDLCEEYSAKTAEQTELLNPIVARVEQGAHGMTADGVAYFTLRQRVVANYLLNVGFYLYLRGLGRSTAEISAHPCIKRIVHARKIFADLEPLHARMCDELESAQAEGTFSFDGPVEGHAAGGEERDVDEDAAAAAAAAEDAESNSDDSIEQEILAKKAKKKGAKGKNKGGKKKKKKSGGAAAAVETTYAEVSFEDAQKQRKVLAKAAKKDAKRRRKAAVDFGETQGGDDDLGEAVAERKEAKKAKRAERAAAKEAASAAASGFSLDDDGLGYDLDGLGGSGGGSGLDGGNLTAEDAAADAFYQAVLAAKDKKKSTKEAGFAEGFDVGAVDDETEENRSITWAMKANKGLTPSRKKEVRNPRVRNRNQHKKRTKQRGGQVQKIRTEKERYRGEEFGIKANVIKSVKLK